MRRGAVKYGHMYGEDAAKGMSVFSSCVRSPYNMHHPIENSPSNTKTAINTATPNSQFIVISIPNYCIKKCDTLEMLVICQSARHRQSIVVSKVAGFLQCCGLLPSPSSHNTPFYHIFGIIVIPKRVPPFQAGLAHNLGLIF